jgi:hypothetical protein
MVLHTDEPHPHVHMVVKALSEEGGRLNIDRARLRSWRAAFARQLREQGVAANATDRRVRGVVKPQKTDGIYRAAMRGASTHWRRRVEAVARELSQRRIEPEPGKEHLLVTRKQVLRGWRAVDDELVKQNQLELARQVRSFVARMPPPQTEKEFIAAGLIATRERPDVRGSDLTR